MKTIPSRIFVSLIIVLFFFSSLTVLNVNSQVEDTWTSLAPMPTPRKDFGLAEVDNTIYAIGGRTDDYASGGKNTYFLSVNEMYNPKTNKWTSLAPMPTPRESFAIFTFENKIHVMGGIADGHKETPTYEIYDPQTDTWETKTPIPPIGGNGIRTNYDTIIVNNIVYILGGQISPFVTLPSTNHNTAYDPKTDKWTEKNPLLYPTADYASAVVESKIFVIGGRNNATSVSTFNSTQIYDTKTDTWKLGTSLELPTRELEGGTTTGTLAPVRIYAFGGRELIEGQLVATCTTRVYSPDIDSWSSGSMMPTQRSSFEVIVVEDRFYLIGGKEESLYTGINERYTPLGYGTPELSDPDFPVLIVSSIIIIVVSSIAILAYGVKTKRRS